MTTRPVWLRFLAAYAYGAIAGGGAATLLTLLFDDPFPGVPRIALMAGPLSAVHRTTPFLPARTRQHLIRMIGGCVGLGLLVVGSVHLTLGWDRGVVRALWWMIAFSIAMPLMTLFDKTPASVNDGAQVQASPPSSGAR